MKASSWGIGIALLVVALLPAFSIHAQPFERPMHSEPLEGARFYIGQFGKYAGASWVYESSTDKVIGYARWHPQNRRWTLFTLKGEYHGFIQGTVGRTPPPHYLQYLWYDREHRYKGVFIVTLGGGPVTPDLPFGELGGQLELREIGNIPPQPPFYEVEPDPLRRLPFGRDSVD
jgi:hypothetical protein